jgi:hypothetical protein
MDQVTKDSGRILQRKGKDAVDDATEGSNPALGTINFLKIR